MAETIEEIEEKAPPGTRGISYADMARFRVDTHGRLSWNGQLVQAQRKVTLSLWQAIATATIAIGTTAQGLLTEGRKTMENDIHGNLRRGRAISMSVVGTAGRC